MDHDRRLRGTIVIKSGLNSFPRPKYASGAATPAGIILMHFDGTNGSTTFTDVHGVVAPTATGAAALDTSTFQFGTASLKMPTGTYISGTASSSSLNFGTGNFDLECWAFITANPGAGSVWFAGFRTTSSGASLLFGLDGPTGFLFCFRSDGTTNAYARMGAISLNAWHAIALSRVSGNINFFVDGVYAGQATDSINLNMNGLVFSVGSNTSIGGTALGGNMWIDELRISNIGRYPPVNYTPSGPFSS